MGGKKPVNVDVCAHTGERITSPRSLDACRRLGIEPDELVPKSVVEFLHQRPSITTVVKFTLVEKEAAVLRHQHYELNRQTKIESVRRERDAILLQAAAGATSNTSPTASRSPTTRVRPTAPAPTPGSQPSQTTRRVKSAGATTWRAPAAIAATSADKGINSDDYGHAVAAFSDSTMVQLEEKRLAKMKLRQQREIQSVVEMETKMAKIQIETTRRAVDDARRRDDFQRDLKAKRTQLVANKHAREIEAKQQEDREAAQRRVRAKEHAEREHLAQQEDARRQQERQHQALQRELERSAKADEFKRQTEALLQQQDDVVAANRQRMLEKERDALALIELANRRRHDDAIERRARAQARLEHATAQNQLTLERKKTELETKQASACERAKEIQRKTMLELKERALQQRKDDDVRLQRLEAVRHARERDAAALLARRLAAEAKLAQTALERERMRQLESVEKSIASDDKQQSVERIKRRDEYARRQLLARLEDEDARSRSLKAQKHALMLARQHVTLDSMRRKHRIAQAMEHIRTSNKWDKIEETLEASGAIDIDGRTPRAMLLGGGNGSALSPSTPSTTASHANINGVR